MMNQVDIGVLVLPVHSIRQCAAQGKLLVSVAQYGISIVYLPDD